MKDKKDYIGLAGAVGGLLIPMILFIGVFLKEDAWVVAPVAASMCALGIAIGYFMSKEK